MRNESSCDLSHRDDVLDKNDLEAIARLMDSKLALSMAGWTVWKPGWIRGRRILKASRRILQPTETGLTRCWNGRKNTGAGADSTFQKGWIAFIHKRPVFRALFCGIKLPAVSVALIYGRRFEKNSFNLRF